MIIKFWGIAIYTGADAADVDGADIKREEMDQRAYHTELAQTVDHVRLAMSIIDHKNVYGTDLTALANKLASQSLKVLVLPDDTVAPAAEGAANG
jgi:hypothetical protein